MAEVRPHPESRAVLTLAVQRQGSFSYFFWSFSEKMLACVLMYIYIRTHASKKERSGNKNHHPPHHPPAVARQPLHRPQHLRQAAWNLGHLCGQTAEDPRFNGQPTVTCSDNAAYHASRVDPEEVARIPVLMFRDLLERRTFDDARLFGRWYRMIVDGSVKEKCRQGFEEGGKSSTNGARYRYVLQLSVVGPEGTLFPLMHEEMDMRDPVADKEDCELK